MTSVNVLQLSEKKSHTMPARQTITLTLPLPSFDLIISAPLLSPSSSLTSTLEMTVSLSLSCFMFDASDNKDSLTPRVEA